MPQRLSLPLRALPFLMTGWLIFMPARAMGHTQPVHQYIAREGYALLLKEYGKDIPQLSAFIGLADPSYAGDSAWQKGYITTGAWREDDEDVVYHYDIFPGLNYPLTSITHFWPADNGDDTENKIRLQYDNPWPLPPTIVDIGPFPNAYSKLMKFAEGGWVLNYPRAILCQNSANNHILAIAPLVSTGGFGIPVSYNRLVSFYKDKKLFVRSEQPSLCYVYDFNDLKEINLSDVAEIRVEEQVRNTIVWEILGRMCHLLADMSVPAHAHGDEHGLNPDSYEDYIGGAGNPYTVWTSGNVDRPIILDSALTCDSTRVALHFLMYAMQQQADHFGSNGPASGNGNDILGGNGSILEFNFLNNIGLGTLGPPTTDGGPWSTANLDTIRDKTLPFAIQATAGLLYWFCLSTGIAPALPTDVHDRAFDLPAAATLSQNYPNPFNPTTRIDFRLMKREHVSVRIFDVVGRTVATLVDEPMAPGSHTVVWEARNSASGTYFCRLSAGPVTETRKMVLLR